MKSGFATSVTEFVRRPSFFTAMGPIRIITVWAPFVIVAIVYIAGTLHYGISTSGTHAEGLRVPALREELAWAAKRGCPIANETFANFNRSQDLLLLIYYRFAFAASALALVGQTFRLLPAGKLNYWPQKNGMSLELQRREPDSAALLVISTWFFSALFIWMYNSSLFLVRFGEFGDMLCNKPVEFMSMQAFMVSGTGMLFFVAVLLNAEVIAMLLRWLRGGDFGADTTE